MLHVKEVSGYSQEILENEFYGSILYGEFWNYILQLIVNFFIYLAVAVCLDELSFSFLEKSEDEDDGPPDNSQVVQLGKLPSL